MLGGFIATIPAAIFYDFSASIGRTIVPSQVIASGIVVLLAGLTLVQSLLDGVTGSPVTASARFFQTALSTGGIVAGVAMGLFVTDMFGVGLPPIETMLGRPSIDSVAFRIFGSAMAAAAYAVTCFAEKSAVLVSFITGAAGSTIYYMFLLPFGTDRFMATAACATVVGLAGGLVARRFMISPVITAVAGVTPFLPGSGIYRGMYAVMNEQMVVGLTNIFSAIATCLALAGGVVFVSYTHLTLQTNREE